MNVLFYIDDFRDRDFWPIARSVVRAGHQIYYGIAQQESLERVVDADRHRAFDLVVSSDKTALTADGTFVNRRLINQPPLVEMAYNDLAEIVTYYGGDDHSFSSLRENAVTLACMDRDLRDSAIAAGVPSAVYLQFGVQPFAIADAGYFPTRLGTRLFGWIDRADLVEPSSMRRTTSRPLDVVFLGECFLGTDPVFVEYLGKHFLTRVPTASIIAADVRIREELGRSVTESPGSERAVVQAALDRHLPECDANGSGRIGSLLMTEYYEIIFRATRRLAYVRHLSAALGDRFHLYGDDFIEQGLPARPSDHSSTEEKYLGSKISIDFGSQTYNSSLDMRPTRIISCESLLVQLRRNDADHVYGGLASRMTFNSPDEMLAMVDDYLASPATRASTAAEELALSATHCGMDAIVSTFLAARPWLAFTAS